MISKAGIRKRRERERQKNKGLALVQEWVPEEKIPQLREAARRLRDSEPEDVSPSDLMLRVGKLLEAERKACARLCRDPETRAAILTRIFDPDSEG